MVCEFLEGSAEVEIEGDGKGRSADSMRGLSDVRDPGLGFEAR
jgi:hypothetical protein